MFWIGSKFYRYSSLDIFRNDIRLVWAQAFSSFFFFKLSRTRPVTVCIELQGHVDSFSDTIGPQKNSSLDKLQWNNLYTEISWPFECFRIKCQLIIFRNFLRVFSDAVLSKNFCERVFFWKCLEMIRPIIFVYSGQCPI